MSGSRLSSSEGDQHAKRAERLGCAEEVERMKLGRFPFAAAIPHHMERRYGTIADSTYKEEERKLRYMERAFEEMKGERGDRYHRPKAHGSTRNPSIHGLDEAQPY